MAVFGDVEAGVIVHLPESKYDENKEENDRLLIIHPKKQNGKWSDGDYYDKDTPIPNGVGDSYGKDNGKILLKYQENNNGISFPLFSEVDTFAPEGCSGVCGAGEWYIATINEVYAIYNNRFMLYNTTKDNNFFNLIFGTSNEANVEHMYRFYLTGDSSADTGIYNYGAKNFDRNCFPMMSIYVR